MLSLDSVTRAEYDAISNAAERAALVVAAFGTVTATVYDDLDAPRASGVMQTPWASVVDGAIVLAELASFQVTDGGTPAGWTLKFESGARSLTGSFGLEGDGADFTWSLPTFATGQAGSIGDIEVIPHGGQIVEADFSASWGYLTAITSSFTASWSIAATSDELTVSNPPAIMLLPGTSYSLAQHVSGGTPPYTYRAVSALPTGLSLSPSTGLLSAASGSNPVSATNVTFGVADSEAEVEEPPPPPTGDVPAWVSALALNTWTTLPNTRMDAVMEPDPMGRALNRSFGWCGATFKRSGSEIFVMTGGHDDGYSNAIYSLKLNQTTPGWVRRNAPSTSLTLDASHNADGTPVARHTYWNIQFNQTRNLLMFFGCAAATGNALNFATVDAFDPVTNTYLPAGTFPNSSSMGVDRAICMDDADNCYHQSSAGSSLLQKWANGSGTWATVGSTRTAYNDGPALVHDTGRNRLVRFDRYRARLFGMTGTMAETTGADYTGATAAKVRDKCSAVYIPAGEGTDFDDRYIVTEFGARLAGAALDLHVVNPSTFAVTAASVAGTKPTLRSDGSGHTYGRLIYDPTLKVLVLVPHEAKNVYVMRLA